ncbi:MAG: hypothetical protein CBD97_02170 [Pelagibacteraceae bacterium TMED237]|nr:MAG: hypothetical protein CBD97_02170 [Pelagibacteraceae bacterium TMED237]|tara:strand:- start:183 stop:3401 length:3219 start_codon:yes stop_codon:yes gene_type:complete
MNIINSIFTYSWYLDEDDTEITTIRIYGIDTNNNTICLRITDFTPYIYIELPNDISWTTGKAQLVGNKIDEILFKQKPLSKVFLYKKKLYGAHLDEHGKRKMFPYLFCRFSNKGDIRNLCFKLKNKLHIMGLGSIKLKIHESDADPILQLVCCRDIPTAGWIKYKGKKVEEKITSCKEEYIVKWKNILKDDKVFVPKPRIMGFDIEVNSTNPSAMPKAEKPGDKVFQISCVISQNEEETKYLLTLGEPDNTIVGKETNIINYKTEADLLIGFTTLINKENINVVVGYNILGFDIPYMIARSKFNSCIFDFDKQGFNKFSHAKEKIIKWSSSAYKNQEFEFLDAEGRIFVDLLPLVKRDFKFNNYKLKTIAEYFIGETKDPLTAKGIFKCYRLGIKKNKDNQYSYKAKKAMGIVGKYCVQDSVLVIKLMDKLKTWVGLTEMATVCNVPIFTLYTQGQQIKVFSQLYKYCMSQNIVVEKDAYQVNDNERYVGAKVFPPIPGKYKMVVPFDFASLYPTTIEAYNIDYHTWVPETCINIPDNLCHVMEWEDHIGCCHDPKVIRKMELTKYIDSERDKIKKIRDKKNSTIDKLRKKELMEDINKLTENLKPYVSERADLSTTISKTPMCCKRKYRFLKEPAGVLPTVIKNCLAARKHTRKVDMKKCKDEIKKLEEEKPENYENLIIELKSMLDVLDKRQLAYKVSANSMYGAMGVQKGYLPFMPGAMCTTYMGRVNIEIVAKVIPDKFGGELIYGDTDSNYIHFPHLQTAEETWDYALHVASEVTKLFPKPIELEFEEEIYAFFFILSKKRYMYRKCLRDGVIDKKIGKKGVLLARRDNSKFIRDVYEEVITYIADDKSRETIIYNILKQFNELCSKYKPLEDFIVTKSIGSINDGRLEKFVNEKGITKGKIGDYTVSLLPNINHSRKEWEKQMSLKKILIPELISEDDIIKMEKKYYIHCLPAQVQLAEKMKERGQRIDAGTRLEYVITDPDNHNFKQYEKIESAEYVKKHGDIIKLDYMYYLKALINPLDQLLDVAFKDYKKGFVMEQYKFRSKIRFKLLNELKKLFQPKITLID